MNRLKIITGVILLIFAFWLSFSGLTLAISAPPLAAPSGLSLAELKITGSEFVMLVNNTGAAINDLGQYWLYGFNNVNPLASGVSSSSQQLPDGSLLNGQTLLLSQGGATCGAAVTGKLSISLTDSGGYLEIVKTSMVNNVLTQTAGDAVSWSSSTNSAAGMISKVPSNSADPYSAWYRYQNSTPNPPYLWQQADIDSTNICQLKVTVQGNVVTGPSNPDNQLLPGTPPPATIVSIGNFSETSTGLPPSDIGLMAPVLNELLPNPAKPQTDTNDEFVELYNPNSATFDLSGFKLQTKSNSSTTMHTYTFPAGTKISGKSFAAYPSANISISLSNSGAQVWLLDPSGNVISQTEPYSEAKDGQAWALANGKWYWTSTPTAGVANVITAYNGAGNSTSNGVGTVLGADTTNPSSNSSNANSNTNQKAAPIHSGVLVAVGVLALLYGVYEYRQDVANWVYKFKRNRTSR